MSDWGKGVNNDIGWGQGANNDIGWGSIYDKSFSGDTLLGGGGIDLPFTLEVKTDNYGFSNDNQFRFSEVNGDYDVIAKQNGVTVQTFNNLSDAATITFSNGVGTYSLEVFPKEVDGFRDFRLQVGDDDKDKVLKANLGTNVFWTEDLQQIFTNGENLSEILGVFENASNINRMTRGFQQLKTLTIRPDVFKNAVNIDRFDNCFLSTTLTVDTYSKMLINLEASNVKDNVPFHGGDSKYDPTITDSSMGSNLTTAQALTNLENRGWTITDNGPI